jgi:hypothetical protein
MSDKPAERYGYLIHTEAIRPIGKIHIETIRPVGKIYTHIAEVTRIVDRKLGIDLQADQFGETWGENPGEAYDKMKAKVESWIASQDQT